MLASPRRGITSEWRNIFQCKRKNTDLAEFAYNKFNSFSVFLTESSHFHNVEWWKLKCLKINLEQFKSTTEFGYYYTWNIDAPSSCFWTKLLLLLLLSIHKITITTSDDFDYRFDTEERRTILECKKSLTGLLKIRSCDITQWHKKCCRNKHISSMIFWSTIEKREWLRKVILTQS